MTQYYKRNISTRRYGTATPRAKMRPAQCSRVVFARCGLTAVRLLRSPTRSAKVRGPISRRKPL